LANSKSILILFPHMTGFAAFARRWRGREAEEVLGGRLPRLSQVTQGMIDPCSERRVVSNSTSFIEMEKLKHETQTFSAQTIVDPIFGDNILDSCPSIQLSGLIIITKKTVWQQKIFSAHRHGIENP
jgi:hypothetical protein